MTTRSLRALAIGIALAIAAPGYAGDTTNDAKDTVTEKKAQAKKKLRKAKPGERTAGDRVEDGKDTAKEMKAKTKKQGRKAKKKVRAKTNEVREDLRREDAKR